MKISAKKERDMARESVISKALELFASEYDDVMLIESNQFCFPLVGVNGTERSYNISFLEVLRRKMSDV